MCGRKTGMEVSKWPMVSRSSPRLRTFVVVHISETTGSEYM
jgi:hypothetical protein